MSDAVRVCAMNAKSSKKDWKWQRKLTSFPKLRNAWKSAESSWQKWLSDSSQEQDRDVDGFRDLIASDGSLKGVLRRNADSGWAVVQRRGGAVGTLLAELGVQSTIDKSGAVGVHHDLPSIRTAWASLWVFGVVKRDALGQCRNTVFWNTFLETVDGICGVKAHRTTKEKKATAKEQTCHGRKMKKWVNWQKSYSPIGRISLQRLVFLSLRLVHICRFLGLSGTGCVTLVACRTILDNAQLNILTQFCACCFFPWSHWKCAWHILFTRKF